MFFIQRSRNLYLQDFVGNAGDTSNMLEKNPWESVGIRGNPWKSSCGEDCSCTNMSDQNITSNCKMNGHFSIQNHRFSETILHYLCISI